MSFFAEDYLRELGYYSRLDQWERWFLRWAHRIGLLSPRAYIKDVIAYTDLSIDEVLRRAQDKAKHKATWFKKRRGGEIDYRAFYEESDWYIFRQPWRYRFQTWHFLTTMLPPHGSMVEYGCGAACMTEWMSRRYPNYCYTVADIPSSSLEFVRFRLRSRTNVTIKEIGMGKAGLPLAGSYNLIVCIEVLEHTINPDQICEHFCDHLAEGGLLYVDFQSGDWEGENLGEARNLRPVALEILKERLHALKAIDDHSTNWGLYRRE